MAPGSNGSMDTSGALLTIDLDALVANWRALRARHARGACAGVVKADAYGLGMAAVAPALARAGCTVFFVAHLDEGIALRALLPDADIHVLNGLLPGTGPVFAEHRLIPVLNSLAAIDEWRRFAAGHGNVPAADVHVDTGMRRLGLPPYELDAVADDPGRLAGMRLDSILSHLACADEPDHPLNAEQLGLFTAALSRLPRARRSFANSSGLFLEPEYHFDLGRPGIAVYGGNPVPGRANPMRQVVRLQGRILQVRDVDTPQTVGYGATYRVTEPGRVATVAVGYADGYLRSLSSAGTAFVGNRPAPVIGRVSMDLITLDVSRVPDSAAVPGATVDLIGPANPVDDVAARAGTISYEILTSLGARYKRAYVGKGR